MSELNIDLKPILTGFSNYKNFWFNEQKAKIVFEVELISER